MIRLTEISEVQASPADIWAFLTSMDVGAYQRWHPHDHLGFRELRSTQDPTGVGRVVRFREKIGKRIFAFTCTVTSSEPGSFVEFRLRPVRLLAVLGRGYFRLDRLDDDRTRLEAVVEIGCGGHLGGLSDRMVARVVDLKDLQRHMHEEGDHLSAAAKAT